MAPSGPTTWTAIGLLGLYVVFARKRASVGARMAGLHHQLSSQPSASSAAVASSTTVSAAAPPPPVSPAASRAASPRAPVSSSHAPGGALGSNHSSPSSSSSVINHQANGKPLARIVPSNPDGLRLCSKLLREGKLVAFPTETVYGLGACAFDAKALASIFVTKGRPTTDPLIVHVTDEAAAKKLLDLGPETALRHVAFKALAKAFWPGPITMIAPAKLSAFGGDVQAVGLVTANTGLVGIRVPEHPVARRLLEETKLPVAAPSANRFGHVSPTSAAHVMDDLGNFPIFIIGETGLPAELSCLCRVGIESTVIDLSELLPTAAAEADSPAGVVKILRRGGVAEGDLIKCLRANGLDQSIQVVAVERAAKPSESPMSSPGQLLTHYAPDVATFLATRDAGVTDALPCALEHTVVLDFGMQLPGVSAYALAFRDLSRAGDVDEACAKLFDALRWAESVPNVRAVLIADAFKGARIRPEGCPALADRMFRAASGRRVRVVNEN